MAKRKSKNNLGGVVLLMIGAAVGVGGFAAYTQLNPKAREIAPELRRQQEPKVAVSMEPEQQVKVFLPYIDGDETKLRPEKMTVPDGEDSKKFAVQEFLTRSKLAPASVRLQSITVHEGTADLNFSKEFGNKGMGSMEEGTLLSGLQKCLGQFKEISKFKILVDGKPIESVGEHFDASEPIDVIR